MSDKDKTIVPSDERNPEQDSPQSTDRSAPTVAATMDELTKTALEDTDSIPSLPADTDNLEQRIRSSIDGTSARVRVDPLIGTVIADRFEILTKIGTGGMGTVYKARQRSMDRFVAVKVLLKQYVTNETVVKRFQREALAVSKLEHPHTVRIYDFGQTEDGTFYLAMEYLNGFSLSHWIRHDRQLPVRQSLTVVRQIALSLDEAHNKGIIHRDLKPDNIFVSDGDESQKFAKVLDFGVAKLREVQEDTGTLTQHGTIFGTPKYMSPEQCRCEGVDGRSDLYSLGIILYEMLSGRVPFDSENPLAILIMHAQESVRPLNEVRPNLVIPFEVEELLHRMMAKKADERPESVKKLVQEIDRVMQKLPNEFDHVLTYEAAEEAGMSYARSQAFTVPDAGRPSPGMGSHIADPRSNKTIAVQNLPSMKPQKSKIRLFMAAIFLSILITGGVLYANLNPLPTQATLLFPNESTESTEHNPLPNIHSDLISVTVRANLGDVTVLDNETGRMFPQRIKEANKPIVFRWLREDRKTMIRLERAGSTPILREVDLSRNNDLEVAVFSAVADTQTVALTVQSNVGAARVSIVGSDQLFAMPANPAESRVMNIPVGDKPMTIRMEKVGHQTIEKPFVPTQDGRLLFELPINPEAEVVTQTIQLKVSTNVGRVDIEVLGTGATYRTPKRGKGPLLITMTRSEEAHELLFKRRGYESLKRAITPNVDQDLTIKLKRKTSTSASKPTPEPSPIKISPIKKTPKPKPARIKLTPFK